MKIVFDILRRKSAQDVPQRVRIPYEATAPDETVARALENLNAEESLRDEEGTAISPIFWEHSCLQKKCGACAMRINGKPRLACMAKLAELGETITLEPLAKFPVVRDLVVDRDILRENLKEMQTWPAGEIDAAHEADTYDASRCLQCGLCLEVCPNFYAGGTFFGTAALLPTARLLSELPREEQKRLRAAYRKHIYSGCGKSLACRDVCPAKIDIERLLARSNAVSIWKRRW